jgi:nickel-type superoxide dismutase maturation protease
MKTNFILVDLRFGLTMFKLIKVKGNSLTPEYDQGDYVIVTTLSFVLRALKSGDIVVFNHPVYGTMIKRIQSIDPQTRELFVIGTHPQSTDSRTFGTIPQSWLFGKVLWHIPNPNRSKS